MAIRRCPYCKAIIDEKEKYCNNCGTQLLFPEDEMVDEEIPGEKIVEEEGEKEEPVLKEEEAGDEEEEESTEDELKGREGEEEEESEDQEESEEGEEEEEDELEEEEKEWKAEGEEDEEKEELEPESRQESPPAAAAKREDRQITPSLEDEKKYELSIEEDELVFKTKELESLTRDVGQGQERLEKFIETYQKEKDKEKEKTPTPTGEAKTDLPPWATGMKEAPSSAELEREAEEKTGEEPSSTQREWTTDSGIGIPEKVTQPALPFATTDVLKVGEEVRGEEDEAGRAARGFSLRLKAKLVDVVFITALWLISLWFTAEVVGASFFGLIANSPVPVLAFYLILLVLYFFLFLYFLGETLGDHYFSEEE